MLEAWKNSFLFFKPSTFKIFLRNTATTLLETYKVWFKYWWWLIGLYLLGGFFIFRPLTNLSTPFIVTGFLRDIDLWYIPSIIASCLVTLIYITLFLAAQPSLKVKNYAYFFSHMKQALLITLWFFITSGLYRGYRDGLDMLLTAQRHAGTTFSQMVPTISLVITTLLALLLAIFSLFFIISILKDVLSSLRKSSTSAIKMALYNMPFWVIVSAIFCAIYFLLALQIMYPSVYILHIKSWIVEYVHFCFDVLIALPFLACTTTVFYFQEIKEHPSWYK